MPATEMARVGGYCARQRSPHMDRANLRGVMDAVKQGKRAAIAFDCGCIIIATRQRRAILRPYGNNITMQGMRPDESGKTQANQ